MGKMFYKFVKRLFDIVFAIIGCILMVPVAIVIKIAYLLDGDTHSIFYTQPRIGKDYKTFQIYKFRSMVWDAEKVLEELMEKNPKIKAEYETNKKIKDDPRITKIGKLIRRCSVDEIPQFINVLKGDMSLIGNRPYLIRERKGNQKWLNKIVLSKPGITGMWQVSGHNDVSFRGRLEVESIYSDTACFATDAKIFFRTFGAILGGLGGKVK